MSKWKPPVDFQAAHWHKGPALVVWFISNGTKQSRTCAEFTPFC